MFDIVRIPRTTYDDEDEFIPRCGMTFESLKQCKVDENSFRTTRKVTKRDNFFIKYDTLRAPNTRM